jgi:hypothetical protein
MSALTASANEVLNNVSSRVVRDRYMRAQRVS